MRWVTRVESTSMVSGLLSFLTTHRARDSPVGGISKKTLLNMLCLFYLDDKITNYRRRTTYHTIHWIYGYIYWLDTFNLFTIVKKNYFFFRLTDWNYMGKKIYYHLPGHSLVCFVFKNRTNVIELRELIPFEIHKK